MKKVWFVFVVAALTVFSFNMAFARSIPGIPNELNNGSFEDEWTSWNHEGDIDLFESWATVTPSNGSYMVGIAQPNKSGKAYQVVDDTLSPGWNPDYNHKEVDLSAYVNVQLMGSVGLDLAYIPIDVYSGDDPPEWNDPRWVDLGIVAQSDSSQLGWQYIQYHEIWDYQPRWIRVSVDVESSFHPDSYAFVDDVDFESRCVPLPGAVWLLGSGLMGLLGMRRKQHG